MPDYLPFDDAAPKYLNIGCGRHFHAQWTNLDLESTHPSVIAHDVTQGVPYQNHSFDMVYHSHVLEHLKPEAGHKLIEECFRVLKPGGVLRVVVPDLEQIARLYLEMHRRAWSGEPNAEMEYGWMKLELLDQLVRDHSGGRMGPYMVNQEIKDSEFVRSRVGQEFWICRATEASHPICENSWRKRIARTFRPWREKLAKRCVKILLGREARTQFQEGMFRGQGEIHRWMYDRYSLRELCLAVGFEGFEVCTATESYLDDFSIYSLDAVENRVRKPDSLFVECRKPAVAVREQANRVTRRSNAA